MAAWPAAGEEEDDDETYPIRDGTGLGSGAAQWGPRRGIIAGFEPAF